MRLFAVAPFDGSTFDPTSPAAFFCFLGVFLSPFGQGTDVEFSMVRPAKNHKVSKAVIRSVAIDVVDTLLRWIKQAAEMFLHHKAVLLHVLISLAGVRVIRCVHLYIPIPIYSAAAFPSRRLRSFFISCGVADDVKRSLASPISTVYSIMCRNWRKATAPVFATFGRVAGYLFPALGISRFCLRGAGVMATNKNLSFVGGATAPAFAFRHLRSSSLGRVYNDIRWNVKYKEVE